MKRRALLAAAAATACTTAIPAPVERPTAGPTDGALLAGMSLADRAAQVMSVAFHGRAVTPHLERMIRQTHVGGVVLFRENFEDAAALLRLTGDLARLAREAGIPPLFVALDQEGGPVVRLAHGAAVLPAQMALAASPDPPAAVARAAAITARELRALGVNWQLAPVADVNDEPRNPIIGNRSFGSDPAAVSDLVAVAVRAYANAGLLCCAKHFPGHGSVTVDSHVGLPTAVHGRERLEAVELAPFRAAIAAGVPAIMSAHIVIPAVGASDVPATLSPAVMTDLLRGRLGFGGLAVTDDLEMGALEKAGGAARAGVAAIAAGSDYLLYRFDEGAQLDGHRRIVDAVRGGSLPPARLEEACRRVLAAKERWNVLQPAPAPAFDPAADRAEALALARDTITVLRAGGLPLRGRILAVSFGTPDITPVAGQPSLADLAPRLLPQARGLALDALGEGEIARAVSAAGASDVVVVGTYDALGDDRQARLVGALQAVRPTVGLALRTPYDLLAYPNVAGYACAYSAREESLVAALDVLAGARQPRGRLPVELPGLYRIGAGMRAF